MNNVNTELSLTPTAAISLNDSGVRGLFGVASGVISLSDGYGKSAGPPVAGYIGWYDYSSYNPVNGVWTDKSGNGNNATAAVSVSQVSVTGNGSSKTFNALRCNYNGGNYGTITWPTNIVPSTYTLFHVCRYTGVSNNRIVQGIGQNWLSGFWANNVNAFYHNGWVAYPAAGTNNNWRYTTDQNNLARQNGTTLGTSGAGSPSYAQIAINNSGYESSECDIVELIVYNSTLNSTQYAAVESYLVSKYGL